MRKPEFGLSENKGADQLCSNCIADQRLCFHYTDSTCTILFLISEISSKPFPETQCTGWFVSDLVRNPEDWFSHLAAYLILVY